MLEKDIFMHCFCIRRNNKKNVFGRHCLASYNGLFVGFCMGSKKNETNPCLHFQYASISYNNKCDLYFSVLMMVQMVKMMNHWMNLLVMSRSVDH